MSSLNIPMSYKLNDAMLENLLVFCSREGLTQSAAVRAGLSLLFSKRSRNTGNTRKFDSDFDEW